MLRLLRLIRHFAKNSEQTTQSVMAIRDGITNQTAQLTEIIGQSERLNGKLGKVVGDLSESQSILYRKLDRQLQLQLELMRALAAKSAPLRNACGDADGPTVDPEPHVDLQIIGDDGLSCLDSSYFHETANRVKQALRSIKGKSQLDVLLFSMRPEYFAVDDLLDTSVSAIRSITFASSEADLQHLRSTFDLAIICSHIMSEQRAEFIIRGRRMASCLAVWTWDNHHNPYDNARSNALADLVLPGHSFCSDRILTPHAVLAQHFPLPTSQWARRMTSKLLETSITNSRSDALYGGFVLWGGSSRDGLLRSLSQDIPDNAITLLDAAKRGAPGSYFLRSPEEQFSDWLGHKVSVVLPFANDLSMRVFDALIAGQVPIIPNSCFDLDVVIPPELQRELPIVRFEELSVPGIQEAWRTALLRYDELGLQGVYRRHRFACDGHHVSVRLRQIVEYLMGLAHEDISLNVKVAEESVGLLLRSIGSAQSNLLHQGTAIAHPSEHSECAYSLKSTCWS
jgi:hypothetical protein